jgi:hypothetical protein
MELAREAPALFLLHRHEAVRQRLELGFALDDAGASGFHQARAERGDDAREEERADREHEAILRHVLAVREQADEQEPLREERPDERRAARAPRADHGRTEEQERQRVRQERRVAGGQREVGEGVAAHAEDDQQCQRVDTACVHRDVARSETRERQQRMRRVGEDTRRDVIVRSIEVFERQEEDGHEQRQPRAHPEHARAQPRRRVELGLRHSRRG